MNGKNKKNEKNDIFLIDLQLISSIVFILTSLVSLIITFDEKGNIINGKRYFSKKQTLNLSFYNRIIILIAILVSFYVGFENYKSETEAKPKFKSGLLLSTSALTVISAIIILYVAYLNKIDQTLTVSDVENPLI